MGRRGWLSSNGRAASGACCLRRLRADAALQGQCVPQGAIRPGGARCPPVCLGRRGGRAGYRSGADRLAARRERACSTRMLRCLAGGTRRGWEWRGAQQAGQVRRFLESHGEGRFTWWHRASDDHNARRCNGLACGRMLTPMAIPSRAIASMAPSTGSACLQPGRGVDLRILHPGRNVQGRNLQGLRPSGRVPRAGGTRMPDREGARPRQPSAPSCRASARCVATTCPRPSSSWICKASIWACRPSARRPVGAGAQALFALQIAEPLAAQLQCGAGADALAHRGKSCPRCPRCRVVLSPVPTGDYFPQ